MRTGTQSIDRAAGLLVRVVESARPPTAGELARAAGLPRSTVSRLLAALERQGLVQRENRRGTVAVGPVLLRLASRGVSRDDLVELSGSALNRLADASSETINLAVPTPDGVEHLAQVDSPHFLGSSNWVGRRVPHHCTAVGKVFLAFGAVEPQAGRLPALTAATITDPGVLASQLDVVRARGWATAGGELEPGLTAIAAPVLGSDGRAVAALSISGPDIRLTQRRLEDLAATVVLEAAQLSARLGHRNATEGAA
ncbi:MAG TPA: IclR family transcriptional regulator [Gaiellales bacterium]|nr:IclR family transcriptional regulator [Gaiellales bacterium]